MLTFLVVLVIFSSASSQLCNNSTDLDQLFKDYFDLKLSANPDIASALGYHEFDTLLPDLSSESMKKLEQGCLKFQTEAEYLLKCPEETWSKTQIHYLRELAQETKFCVEGFGYQIQYLPPLSSITGVQVSLPVQFKRPDFFNLKEIKDYDKVLTRLKAIPKYIDQIQILLHEGVVANITFPVEILDSIRKQFSSLQVPSERSPFYHLFDKHIWTMENITRNEVKVARVAAKKIIANQVLPAYKTLEEYLFGEYEANARALPGMVALPNGKELYKQCLKFHTTKRDADPEVLHQTGLKEIERLVKVVKKVGIRLGLKDLSPKELFDHVRGMPSQKFNTSKAFVDATESLLKNKINPAMDLIFEKRWSKSPRLGDVEVEAIEPGLGGFAFYRQYFEGGKTHSIYKANIDLVQPLMLVPLTLHEVNPGHHFQKGVVAPDLEEQPDFLSKSVTFMVEACPRGIPSRTAFDEGWGLYSELLGYEMGLYQDYPIAELGYLTGALLRAARLVVDTGLHYYGWTFEEAVTYLVDEALFDPAIANGQITRYISVPGQATGYKVGERAILAVRKDREDKLGSDFDLKKFHTHLVSCRGMLTSLEDCVIAFEELEKKN